MRKISLFLIFIIAIFIALNLGRYDIGLSNYLLSKEPKDLELFKTLIFEVRLPRIVAAILIGASLSISGASYQAIFVNPLVSPSILGVLAGASFGAGIAFLFRLNEFFVQILSFAFGFLAVFISLLLAYIYEKSFKTLILVLGGIISGSLFTSLLSMIKYLADPTDALPQITYFLLGSLSFVSKTDIKFVAPPMILGILILIFLSKYLNALSLGDDEAKSLGLNTNRLKIIIILLSTLISALSVTIAGIIGWIGLIIPHISRFLIGADNKNVLFYSGVIGAIFLLFCDTFSRMVLSYELPIGVVTSIFGIPIFTLILLKNRVKEI